MGWGEGPELLFYLEHEEGRCGSLLEQLREVRHHHLGPARDRTSGLVTVEILRGPTDASAWWYGTPPQEMRGPGKLLDRMPHSIMALFTPGHQGRHDGYPHPSAPQNPNEASELRTGSAGSCLKLRLVRYENPSSGQVTRQVKKEHLTGTRARGACNMVLARHSGEGRSGARISQNLPE